MKTTPIKILTLFPAAAFAFSLTACDIDKTEDGEMPEVKVEGEAKLPKYDVEGPKVTVEKKTVEIPSIKVDLPEEEDDSSGTPATEPDADPSDNEE